MSGAESAPADAEIGARLDAARRRIELVSAWMERHAGLVADRVASVAARLERLERDLRDDLLRLRR
jgi:hypothetical protein